LKEIYRLEGGEAEMWVDGYLIDVVKPGLLIEIQTRHLGALKNKLEDLLDNHPIRLVHPIALQKYIIVKTTDGKLISRRRSPKKGKIEDLFYELVYIAKWVKHPNFSFEALLTHEEEQRIQDGKGSWRRKGVSIQDRRLIRIIERRLFSNANDYRLLLPATLVDPFTNQQLANLLSIPHRLASKMTYTLLQIGVLEIEGKQGRSYCFKMTSHDRRMINGRKNHPIPSVPRHQ
jgi:hypothetical protein